MKIGLGTVQFGLSYGISNQEGQTSQAEVKKILEVADEYHVKVIDTAALYGSSEEVLGRTLPGDHRFKIVTKTVRIDADRVTASDVERMKSSFMTSLERLHSRSVYGLLMHNADDLLAAGGEKLYDGIAELKTSGLVTKIGVSVYTAEQIDNILNRFEIDLIQLPLNVLDQRLLAGGCLAALKARGVEIHARSAFLQGLLLMPPDDLPDYFAAVRNHLRDYHGYLTTLGITPLRAALGFLASLPEVDVIVCGVNNHQQFIEICQASGPLPEGDFLRFALDDPAVLNPSLWRTV